MPVAAVDLFCGVGGLTHGLELAGVPVVVGVDVENSCKFAYEHNNRARFVLRDVTQLASDELENYFPEGTTKVLVGCAPCQPFSTYSLRYNKNGKKDDKWRLLYYFANLVEAVLPEIVSMENVPQLSHEPVLTTSLASYKNYSTIAAGKSLTALTMAFHKAGDDWFFGQGLEI